MYIKSYISNKSIRGCGILRLSDFPIITIHTNIVNFYIYRMLVTSKPIVVTKQIAKQYSGVSKHHLHHERARHVFLIRHPLEMLEGWERQNVVHQDKTTLESLSLSQLLEIYSEVRTNGHHPPIVIDADLLQRYPSEVLQILCAKLEIPFESAMLQWTAGPKPYDGYDLYTLCPLIHSD